MYLQKTWAITKKHNGFLVDLIEKHLEISKKKNVKN